MEENGEKINMMRDENIQLTNETSKGKKHKKHGGGAVRVEWSIIR